MDEDSGSGNEEIAKKKFGGKRKRIRSNFSSSDSDEDRQSPKSGNEEGQSNLFDSGEEKSSKRRSRSNSSSSESDAEKKSSKKSSKRSTDSSSSSDEDEVRKSSNKVRSRSNSSSSENEVFEQKLPVPDISDDDSDDDKVGREREEDQRNGKTREYKRGKYYCTIDLLFDLFGLLFLQIKTKNCQLSYSRLQTSQTGGQW
jgi:hypothetical protein